MTQAQAIAPANKPATQKPLTTPRRKKKKLLGDVEERQLLELKEFLHQILEEGTSLPQPIRKLLEEAESLSWQEFSKLHE